MKKSHKLQLNYCGIFESKIIPQMKKKKRYLRVYHTLRAICIPHLKCWEFNKNGTKAIGRQEIMGSSKYEYCWIGEVGWKIGFFVSLSLYTYLDESTVGWFYLDNRIRRMTIECLLSSSGIMFYYIPLGRFAYFILSVSVFSSPFIDTVFINVSPWR